MCVCVCVSASGVLLLRGAGGGGGGSGGGGQCPGTAGLGGRCCQRRVGDEGAQQQEETRRGAPELSRPLLHLLLSRPWPRGGSAQHQLAPPPQAHETQSFLFFDERRSDNFLPVPIPNFKVVIRRFLG